MSNIYRKVAYLNFWQGLFSPKNGGQLRAHGLFNALNTCTNIELINVNGFYYDSDSPKEWKVLDVQGETPLIYTVFLRLFSLVTLQGLFLNSDSRKLLVAGYHTEWFAGYSHVIITSSDMLLAAPIIRLLNKSTRVVYDSHNVDYLLTPPKSRARIKVGFLEWLVPYLVDEIWCCSIIDVEGFIKLNSKFRKMTRVVPNGAIRQSEITCYTRVNQFPYTVGLLASWNYPPNIEGLRWFLHDVMPIVDKAINVIVCGAGALPVDLISLIDNLENVSYVGKVDNVKDFYKEVHAVLIPLHSGSGTRLKAIEAMSFAKPIISTSKGVEGINLTDGTHCLMAEDAYSFAEKINLIFHNEDIGEHIANNALSCFLSHYSWDKIAKNIVNQTD